MWFGTLALMLPRMQDWETAVIFEILFIYHPSNEIKGNVHCIVRAVSAVIINSKSCDATLWVGWCEQTYLKFNVEKTKDLIIDFRRKEEEVLPVITDDHQHKIVIKVSLKNILVLAWTTN